MTCFVSDIGEIATAYKEELIKNNIPFEEGQHSEEVILASKEIMKSPGIPERASIVQYAIKQGVTIISEIEFASRFFKGEIIAITGSNGKTTTTSLIYQILKKAGENVCLGGNIGWSFARVVLDNLCSVVVLELSSFQLDGIINFKPNIAVLLNITPDHLDRYDYKIENYINSKLRITKNQTKEDTLIYFEDDENTKNAITASQINAKLVAFNGFSLNKDLDESKLTIKGVHNWYNASAAFFAAKTYGITEDKIRKEIYQFYPIKHRLQFIKEIQGVEYINDSKATNVDAVKYALDSIHSPTIWIAGGVDKGNDYSILNDVISNVKVLICLGKDNSKLKEFFGGTIKQIIETNSMEEAIEESSKLALSSDTVLLSPACASFDLFKNYEDRGDQFIQLVKNLAK